MSTPGAGTEQAFLATADGKWHVVPDPHNDGPVRARLGEGKTMVVVRESNMFDLLAFATMIRQVLEALVGLVPGVEEVLSLSGSDAEVMRNDSLGVALRKKWAAKPLHQAGKAYGWVFEVSGTLFFFAMTSAFGDAVEDLRNNFTFDLIDEMALHRPAALVTGPSTRLVRRKDLGEALGRQAGLHRVRIFTRETPEGLDLATTTGSTSWTLLCLLAEQDLRSTVMRLFSGRIFHVRNGGWLAGAGGLPLGFVLERTKPKRPLVGDAGQVELARLLLVLSYQASLELSRPEGQRTLSPEEIVARLSVAGAKKRGNRPAGRSGDAMAGADLAGVDSAKTTLVTLLSALPAYRPGGVLRRMQGLPITGLGSADVHGHAIFKRDPANAEEKGAIAFEWRFPRPVGADGKEEPWASPEVLDGAQKYLGHLLSSVGTGYSTERVWPLAGLFRADHGGASYRLVRASGGYQWKRDGAAVGKFDVALVTRRLVDSVVAELGRLGVDPGAVQLARPARPRATELDHLARHKQLKEQFDKACAAVRSTLSTRQQEAHQAEADRLDAELEDLEREMASAAAEGLPSGAQPLTERLLVGDLATLLSVLRDTAGQALPPEVCDLVGRYLAQGTIEGCWDDSAPWGLFRASVLVPREDGFAREVQVSFEVGNTSQGPDRRAFWARRMPRVLEMRMTTSATIEELAARLGGGPSPRRVARNLQDVLGPLFGRRGLSSHAASAAATAALDCPLDSTRAVIWALLNDLPLPEVIEDLDAEETALHIAGLARRWAPGFEWGAAAWSAGGERRRRRAALWVGANTGTDPAAGAPLLGLLSALHMSNVQSINQVLWSEGAADDGTARVLERTVPWPSGAFIDPATGERQVSVPDAEKRVRLRACPHCGHRGLHPLVCVDLGADPLLCLNCQRQPSTGRKFPRSYLADWEGPYGLSRLDRLTAEVAGQRRGTALGRPLPVPSGADGRRARASRKPGSLASGESRRPG